MPTADGAHPNAGWVVEHAKDKPVAMSADGTLTVTGNTRAYLVEDYMGLRWADFKYERADMFKKPLEFTLDLSNVNCGCLACVYLVAMKDPSGDSSNYCDMAENVAPGIGGGTCTELDILEANNHAMQTAIHTELGGSFGSGNCDKNGCFARVGGPQAPGDQQWKYGRGKTIDSARPFDVRVAVDEVRAL